MPLNISERDALANSHRLNCSSHLLNTILTHLFNISNLKKECPQLHQLMCCCTKIVTYAKKGSLDAKLSKSLKMAVVTRWNSNFRMLLSFELAFDELKKYLIDTYVANTLKFEPN